MAVFSGNGSATAPSFTFSSDTNLGIYRGGDDIISFTTAGSERSRIDASGNLEIGGTLGSDPNISLNATDGSASFLSTNAQIQQFNDKAVISLRKENQNLVHFGATDISGELGIDYRSASFQDGTEVIKLNGDIGSASFAGDVQVAGNPGGGVEVGCKTYAAGLIQVSGTAGTGNAVYVGYECAGDGTSSSATSQIYADGSSYFADTMEIGGTSVSPNILLYQGGTIVAKADATINSLTVGLGAGSVSSNTAVGLLALNSNTTGTNNIAVGQEACRSR